MYVNKHTFASNLVSCLQALSCDPMLMLRQAVSIDPLEQAHAQGLTQAAVADDSWTHDNDSVDSDSPVALPCQVGLHKNDLYTCYGKFLDDG